MGSIFGERGGVNLQGMFAEAMAEAQRAVVRQLEQAVEGKLGESISALLGRGAYERRAGVAPWVEIAGKCQRCKSRQSQRFSRNGGRGRTLETRWGVLRVWQQRLVCACGGSVRLEIDGWLRPYQRIGEDVTAQIQRWGALRLSLREMQAELGQLMLSPLGSVKIGGTEARHPGLGDREWSFNERGSSSTGWSAAVPGHDTREDPRLG